ncbi:MAG: hypothetical protein EOO01_43425 [Chitinophagaceae bacterium]|nr:MAG: hypothetical protein EOO01_43425 [Chitinophagaceae bacterium]
MQANSKFELLTKRPTPIDIIIDSTLIMLVYHMRVFLLGLLITLSACNDHKRPNSFDAKPDESVAPPYNGGAAGRAKEIAGVAGLHF